ncbi:MAG TPA: hypothetical protein VH142_04715 [Polyangiaceae bacterium]|jgi:hypothetical protein|nr:hypothetical protein [Polyangiaceae bacterium]
MNVRSAGIWTLALSAVASLAARAEAAPFGEKGDVSFAADRLMGVYIFNEDPTKLTAIGLFSPPDARPYLVTRLGVDFFPIDHLSIGGSFAFWSTDNHSDPRADRTTTGVLFSPRVGYAIRFSDAFGFWPRGGITYRDSEGDDELALTFEGMFYGAPAPHFAFLFGPVLDVGLVGSGSEAVSFGVLTAGIMGWI